MKIVAFTIARMGSKRLPQKNLRLLCGKPMMIYALEAARDSRLISEAYLNTDSEDLGAIGLSTGVKFYKRDSELCEDDIVLDQITYDFISNIECDVIGMVNSVCPLTTSQDIDHALNEYLNSDADTLVTVREEQLHAFLDNKSINFDSTKMIPMTQDLLPVQIVTWNFVFWKSDVFRECFEKDGFGVFSGKVYLYAISKETAVKVSEESDFQIASAMMKARQKPEPVEFYPLPGGNHDV